MCSLSSLNAIRCWQCACVDGRRCPRDAKVNNYVVILFTFVVEFKMNFKVMDNNFKYIFRIQKSFFKYKCYARDKDLYRIIYG